MWSVLDGPFPFAGYLDEIRMSAGVLSPAQFLTSGTQPFSAGWASNPPTGYQSAQSLAMREGHQQFSPLHLLKVLLDDSEGLAGGLIDRAGGNSRAILKATESGWDANELLTGDVALFQILPAFQQEAQSRWLRLVVASVFRLVGRRGMAAEQVHLEMQRIIDAHGDSRPSH